jgi:hypothetical protein
MKIIGTFSLVVIASIPFVPSTQARGYGGGRSFSSAPHFSAPHFSGGSRNFSASRSQYSAPAARYSSGTAYRNRSYVRPGTRHAINRTTALNPRYYSTSGPRFSGSRRANLTPRNYSTGRVAANRTGAFRPNGFKQQERVVARYGNNWHRNWDRSRDHNWHGHRCHWHNNSWIIFDTGFYPWGWGYYPSSYYYDDGYYGDAYYDDRYAANEYASAPSDPSNYETGSRVNDVQSALSRAGYYDGPIDGTLGPATRKALRNYQRDHGLEVTGGINRAVTDALQLR